MLATQTRKIKTFTAGTYDSLNRAVQVNFFYSNFIPLRQLYVWKRVVSLLDRVSLKLCGKQDRIDRNTASGRVFTQSSLFIF